MKAEKQIVLKVQIDEKVYSFNCDEDAPLGAIWDSMQQMRTLIVDQIQSNEERDQKVKGLDSEQESKTEK